jgi:hypothetical protein
MYISINELKRKQYLHTLLLCANVRSDYQKKKKKRRKRKKKKKKETINKGP